MSSKNIVILCDGLWKKSEDSWKWISNGSRSRSSLVQTNLTYEELVEHIYEVTEIDRNLFDIELTYKITTMVEIEPIAIKNSRDIVSFFTWQERDLVPLCVGLIKKMENMLIKDKLVTNIDSTTNVN